MCFMFLPEQYNKAGWSGRFDKLCLGLRPNLEDKAIAFKANQDMKP